MALSLTCSGISQDGAGRIHVRFSDGVDLEFPSKPEALAWGKGADVSSSDALQELRRLLMAWWLKGDPNGNTPATVVGKTITIDLTLAGAVVIA